jgi:hypothetical protein
VKAARLADCISDLTKCAICLDTLNEPRSLSCLHTFCLACLESLHVNSGRAPNLPCPTCRQPSDVPTTGVSGFPHNFFVNSLLNANQCVEYCGEGQHSNTLADKFCLQCNLPVCKTCSVNHASHDCRPASETVTHFCKLIDEAVANLPDSSKLDEHIKRLELEKGTFQSAVSNLKEYVKERGDKIKRVVDRHVASLFKKLDAAQIEVLPTIEKALQDVTAPSSEIQQLRSDIGRLKTRTKLCDFSKAISEVHAKAQRLTDQVSALVLDKYRCPEVHFEPVPTELMSTVFGERKNCVGSISVIRHHFQHHIYKSALHKIRYVVGDALIIMADSCVAECTGPRKAVGVCGPSSTRATKVPWHHSPVNRLESGRGREPHRVSFAPFWLSLLACKLAIQSRTEQNFAKLTPPTRFGKLLLPIFVPWQC